MDSTKTTTRRATTCKIEYHEHSNKVDTITRTTYSDGTKNDVIDSTEYLSRGKVNKGETCNDVDTVISVEDTDDGVIGDDPRIWVQEHLVIIVVQVFMKQRNIITLQISN